MITTYRETEPGSPATVLYLDYTNEIGLGGAQRSLSLLVRHLDRSCYRPVVGCPPDEQLRTLLSYEVPVHDLLLPDSFRGVSRYESPWTRLPNLLAGCGRAIAAVKEMLHVERPSVVHANNLKMLWLASRAARGKVPVIWHVRDIYPKTRFAQSCLKIGSMMATHVVAVSGAVKRQFSPAGKVSVIHNAVELPDLGRSNAAGRQFRAANGIPVDGLVAGFAGRLAPWKGVDRLIAAYAQVRLTVPTLKLMVAGDGPERESLKRHALDSGVGDGIHFIPFQQRLEPLYGAMDFVVVPSVEPDPFPRSVIEAMSYGKPVIGSRDGGIIEAVSEGETGYLVEPNSIEALAQALARLVAEPERRIAYGRAGRQRCEQLFSVQKQARAVRELYQTLAPAATQSEA
jgi:glycosyltransferase involved in cell wall biosynthesis